MGKRKKPPSNKKLDAQNKDKAKKMQQMHDAMQHPKGPMQEY